MTNNGDSVAFTKRRNALIVKSNVKILRADVIGKARKKRGKYMIANMP